MAWIEAVTDRTMMSRCTASDINRISNNINHLQGSNIKQDYVSDDIVTLAQWQTIRQGVSSCCLKYGIKMTIPVDDSATYNNLNQAEVYLSLCNDVLVQREALQVGSLFVGNTGARINAPNLQLKGVS